MGHLLLVTPAVEAGSLPVRTWRGRLSRFSQDLLYRFVPGAAYARLRGWRYARYRDREMQLLKFLLSPARDSIDVGANLGLYTLPMARHSRRVHAFEPNPVPYRLLRHIAPANVVLHHMAVSDVAGEVEFRVPLTRKGWSSNGGRIGATADPAREHLLRIPCTRLDDLQLNDIGFIKIDVEGHELAVLRGASATIERCRPNLLVENEYAHVGAAAQQLFDLIATLGYSGYFVAGSSLLHLSQFSFEQHQLQPRQQPALGLPYVKNFIFLPVKQPAIRA